MRIWVAGERVKIINSGVTGFIVRVSARGLILVARDTDNKTEWVSPHNVGGE